MNARIGIAALLLALGLGSGAAIAAPGADEPAIDTTRPPPASETASAETSGGGVGTTIVGERDSAVGLYLTPWKEEAPSDIDRPPALFDFTPQAIDAQGFEQRTQADDANAAYRRARVEPRL